MNEILCFGASAFAVGCGWGLLLSVCLRHRSGGKGAAGQAAPPAEGPATPPPANASPLAPEPAVLLGGPLDGHTFNSHPKAAGWRFAWHGADMAQHDAYRRTDARDRAGRVIFHHHAPASTR